MMMIMMILYGDTVNKARSFRKQEFFQSALPARTFQCLESGGAAPDSPRPGYATASDRPTIDYLRTGFRFRAPLVHRRRCRIVDKSVINNRARRRLSRACDRLLARGHIGGNENLWIIVGSEAAGFDAILPALSVGPR